MFQSCRHKAWSRDEDTNTYVGQRLMKIKTAGIKSGEGRPECTKLSRIDPKGKSIEAK